jgi:hypothetical protein
VSKPPSPPPQRPVNVGSPALRFRKEIEAALAGGAEPGALHLRLTLSDASRLLRDPATPTGDIRFQDGVMRFLGVEVQKGGVDASTLAILASGADDQTPTA